MRIKIIDVLGKQDGGGTRGTGRLLKNGIVFGKELLRFVNEQKNGPRLLPENLPSLDGALKQIFEGGLDQDTGITEFFWGKVNNNNFPGKSAFGR
jgi:hypothetical protein